MNPHDLWDSCKRSVPDVSLVKEHDKNDYYSPRVGFPLSSTPPKSRNDTLSKNALSSELNSIKLELEKLQRDQEKRKEYEILQVISQQLTDVRAELAEVRKQNELLAIQQQQCKERVDEKKSKEFEILQSICQQLLDLKSELVRPIDTGRVGHEKCVEMIDKEVQVCWAAAEQSTQTVKQPVQRTDYAVKPSISVMDYRPPHRTPLVVKKPNVPQSDLSMTANKILQKYLPDEPTATPAPPPPLWRQTDYENLIFNMTNVSVAMQRPQRNELWQNPSKPRYEEPYSPNFENYRQPLQPMRREYEEPNDLFWQNPSKPRYEENWAYDYRQPEDNYDEPEPDWRPNRPSPKLIGLSAIMNQPKLL